MSKQLTGIVIGNKMLNTVVVEVERFIKHPRYKKIMRRTSSFKVHNDNKDLKIGDRVIIGEVKPISRDVNFIIIDSGLRRNDKQQT
ncbi:MAG: 30S ribosomal protein S17 [Patescibacteria group bacterium]